MKPGAETTRAEALASHVGDDVPHAPGNRIHYRPKPGHGHLSENHAKESGLKNW